MHNNGSQPPIYAAVRSSQPPPAPPAPPPPPPLPVFDLDANPLPNQTMDAGSSNFNAAFDFGSTYAVASSNYDTPFLSASESNWLFNHADLQLDTQMPQASPSTSRQGEPPPPPTPQYAQNEPMLRNVPMHQYHGNSSLYASMQDPPMSESPNMSNGQRSPRHQSLNRTSIPSNFPSSHSDIPNSSQQRKNRHVRFADAQAYQQSLLDNANHEAQTVSNNFHAPLAPAAANENGQYRSVQSFGTNNGQSSPTRLIKISLATRNRLAKHLAVRSCFFTKKTR